MPSWHGVRLKDRENFTLKPEGKRLHGRAIDERIILKLILKN
jgi:hypothetical protein